MLNKTSKMNTGITITFPKFDGKNMQTRDNYTQFMSDFDGEVSRIADPDYEQFLADVWVGIVLTLMVLSCVCCMCSCLLYHKFQQWKRNVLQARRNAANLESGQTIDSESLPSYTIVSGLPSYEEALEQLRQVQSQTKNHIPADNKVPESTNNENCSQNTQPTQMARLSVTELFQFYKTNTTIPSIHTKT